MEQSGLWTSSLEHSWCSAPSVNNKGRISFRSVCLSYLFVGLLMTVCFFPQTLCFASLFLFEDCWGSVWSFSLFYHMVARWRSVLRTAPSCAPGAIWIARFGQTMGQGKWEEGEEEEEEE